MTVAALILMLAVNGPVLSGSDPWRVDPEICRLERRYRNGTDEVRVMVRPDTLSATLIVNNNYDRQMPGRYQITALNITGPTGTARFTPYDEIPPQSSSEPQTTKFGYGIISEAALDAMVAGTTMTVDRLGGPSLTMTIDDLNQARPSLEQCLAESMKMLDVDAGVRARIRIRPTPIGDPVGWFDPSRYRGLAPQGRVRVSLLVTVSPEGRVSACRLYAPSPAPAAAEIGCAELIERGRFAPARDDANEAVTGYTIVPLVLQN